MRAWPTERSPSTPQLRRVEVTRQETSAPASGRPRSSTARTRRRCGTKNIPARLHARAPEQRAVRRADLEEAATRQRGERPVGCRPPGWGARCQGLPSSRSNAGAPRRRSWRETTRHVCVGAGAPKSYQDPTVAGCRKVMAPRAGLPVAARGPVCPRDVAEPRPQPRQHAPPLAGRDLNDVRPEVRRQLRSAPNQRDLGADDRGAGLVDDLAERRARLLRVKQAHQGGEREQQGHRGRRSVHVASPGTL